MVQLRTLDLRSVKMFREPIEYVQANSCNVLPPEFRQFRDMQRASTDSTHLAVNLARLMDGKRGDILRGNLRSKVEGVLDLLLA